MNIHTLTSIHVGMTVMRISLLLVLGLGGCAMHNEATADIPPNAKKIILANKSKLWKDPDSIKPGAAITAPFRSPIFSLSWIVCVRSNAKNGFGGYTGESDSAIALHDPPEVLYEKAVGICDPVPHVPFPELTKG